jgi:hypothetical protein
MKRLMISLQEKTIEEAKIIADHEQIPYSILFRTWIVQRVREYEKLGLPKKVVKKGGGG